MPESVETWIDALAAVMEVDNGRGGVIRSFRAFERNELPTAINSEMMPCVVSYVTNCQPQYGSGSPTILIWRGLSEFHLAPGVQPSNVAYILPFYGRIIAAVMANITLAGKVAHFVIPPDESNAMQFVTYNDEQSVPNHQGLVVQWQVKQNVSGQYEVKA